AEGRQQGSRERRDGDGRRQAQAKGGSSERNSGKRERVEGRYESNSKGRDRAKGGFERKPKDGNRATTGGFDRKPKEGNRATGGFEHKSSNSKRKPVPAQRGSARPNAKQGNRASTAPAKRTTRKKSR
ncbi:DEAD/DEAH box helicase, partial [Brevibacillus formosus]